MIGTACAQIPTAPPRKIDFEFSLQDREGIPLGDATIILRSAGPVRSGSFIGDTDANGRATFRIPEGRYSGSVLSGGGLGYSSHIPIPEFSVSGVAARHVHRLTGFYVTGEIRDPDGAALDSGFVTMFGSEPDYDYVAIRYVGSTFRVLVSQGEYYASAYGLTYPSPYPAAAIEGLTIGNDTTLVFDLVGSRVDGRVTGRAGAPIGGARVYASGVEVSATGTSDAGGNYFLYLPDGSYRWTVTPPESMRYILDRFAPSSAISGPATKDFSLDGALWSGMVVVAGTGAPITAGVVTATPWTAQNRAARSKIGYDGSFRLILEPGLEYDLQVRSQYGETLGFFRSGVADADSVFTLAVRAPSTSVSQTLKSVR